MNNAKHTPGPWTAHCGHTVAYVNSTAPNVAKDGGEATITALIGGQHGATLDELHANARLIAAAPELLQAATAYRNHLRTAAHTEGEVATFEHLSALIAKITAQE